MRAFLILLVLVAIGYAGWSWYTGRNPAAVPVAKVEPAPGDVPSTTALPPVNPPPPPPPAIPAEVKGDYDQAEALWQQAVAAGDRGHPVAGGLHLVHRVGGTAGEAHAPQEGQV